MQILLINDLVGHSKVGMGAMLPVLSYLGHSTYNLPTALVSNTFNYGKFNVLDTTEYIRGTLPVWKELGFHSDAICTGYMPTEEMAWLVADYCREQSAQKTIIFVDPVMGDGGQLYNGITLQQVDIMRQMVAVADLTFPNYTEACYLTGTPYRPEGLSWSEACAMLDGIAALGARSALITSARVDGQSCVIGHISPLRGNPYIHTPFGFLDDAEGGRYFRIDYDEIPVAFHGTGDIFSAVLIGHLMNGKSLKESTRTAMTVVSNLIDRNRSLTDKCRGIPIEQCLDLL